MKIQSLTKMFLGGFIALSLHNTPAEAIIVGAKSMGMAGTSVSHPIDAFAQVVNPAALTELCDRADLGVKWLQVHQRGKIHDLPTYTPQALLYTGGIQPSSWNSSYNAAKTPNTYAPDFALKKGWCRDICNQRVEIAAGVATGYSAQFVNVKYGRSVPFFGDSPLRTDLLHSAVHFTLAGKVCNMHSVGVALTYNILRINQKGLQNFDIPQISAYPGHVTNRGYSYSNGWGLSFGYLFDWNCLKVGLSFEPEVTMNRHVKYKGFFANKGSFDIPKRLRAGISYKVLSCLTFAFDYEHAWLRDIPHLRNPPSNIELIPTDPSFKLGAKNGPGQGFKDQSRYRLGAEYAINWKYTLRTGWMHLTGIIPREYTTGNMVTHLCQEDMFTFGGTYKLNKCNEFSIFYGLGVTKKIKGKNSIPASILSVNPQNGQYVALPINQQLDSTTGLPNGQRADGEVDISQRLCVLGLSWGIYF